MKELLFECVYITQFVYLSVSLPFCGYHVCISMLGLLYTKHCIMYRCLSVCV